MRSLKLKKAGGGIGIDADGTVYTYTHLVDDEYFVRDLTIEVYTVNGMDAARARVSNGFWCIIEFDGWVQEASEMVKQRNYQESAVVPHYRLYNARRKHEKIKESSAGTPAGKKRSTRHYPNNSWGWTGGTDG